MAVLGDFFGISVETRNTTSLFRGISIEFNINFIVSVLASDGSLIDDSCEINLYDAADSSLLSSGNTSNGIYTFSVADPTAIRVEAIHPIEGSITRSFIHDGETVLKVTVSFVPSTLQFHEVNPIKVVLIESPILDTEKQYEVLHEDISSPFFDSDSYQQPFLAQDKPVVQFWSSYQDNFARIYDKMHNPVTDFISPLKVEDLGGGYDVYEYYFDFSSLQVGSIYYIQFTGSDDAQGNYVAESEKFKILPSAAKLVNIEYHNINDAFDVKYKISNIRYSFRFQGEFWRTKYIGDKTVFPNDNYTTTKLHEVKRKHALMRVHGVPHYLLDKINLALAHDVVKINGQLVDTTEDMEPEIEEHLSLVKAEAWLPFKEAFVNRY